MEAIEEQAIQPAFLSHSRCRRPRSSWLSVLIILLLPLILAGTASAAILKDVSFQDKNRESVLNLRFSVEPDLKYVPMTESRILILDFLKGVLPQGRQKFKPAGGLVEFLSLTQFDEGRLRLIIKVAPSTVVNVYRHPVPGSHEVRYVLVVEPDLALHDYRQADPGPKRVPRIVFDPGHGGYDNGALGSITSDKEVALNVARELKKLFERESRVEAYFTRLSDHFVPLEDRTDFARKVQADVFVSLHANMAPRRSHVNGLEVFYLSPNGANLEMSRTLKEHGYQKGRAENRRKDQVDHIILSMQQTKSLDSAGLLATLLHENILARTHQAARGVKRANFKVLRPIEIPSVLIEFGFLSNAAEERKLATSTYHRVAAAAVYESVIQWFEETNRIPRSYARRMSRTAPPLGEARVASAAVAPRPADPSTQGSIRDRLSAASKRWLKSREDARHGPETRRMH